MSTDLQNGSSSVDKALRASELSYRRLFEAAQDGILILDVATGRISDANPFLAKLLGFSHDEMVGKTVGELSPFKDIESNQVMLERLQKGGYVRYEDLPLETRDGRKIAVEFVSNVYEVGDNKVIQCNIRDITERKLSEQQLARKNIELTARNEQLLHLEERILLQSTALATAANGVVITDNKGIILWVNSAFSKLTGYTSEEVITKTPSLLRSGKHDRTFYKNLWETILSGKTWRGDFTNRRKDGSLYHDEHTITPVLSKEGIVTHFIAIMNDVTERKLAEEALCASQRNMSTAQRIAHIGSWEIGLSTPTDRVDKPAQCSDEMFRIAGYEPGSVTPSNELFLKQVPIDEHAMLEAAMAKAIATRQDYSLVHRLIRPNGEERVVQDMVHVIFDDKTGSPLKLVGSTQDITERVGVENQLRSRTAFFEAQVHSALEGILVIDSDGKKILQNQRLIDLWNIPKDIADEVDDRSQLEWVNKQVKNPGQFAERVTYLFNHPDKVSYDELELLDGRSFERYTAPVKGKDGQYYGRIWTFSDVTQRKLSVLQNEQQAALLDKAQDAILTGDLEGHIQFWNKGAEHMYGWTREEVMGRKVSDLLYPDQAIFKTLLNQLVEEGELSGEIEHVAKDGRKLTVYARRTLIRDDQENPKSALVIYTDITEKKKIEAQFMRAQRMESIGTLAGGIAHDLNNILAPIMMSIDVLKTLTENPQATKILETIEVSAKRGADIVRQVLSFSRGLEGERIEVQPKHLLKDLENIIQDTFPKDIRLQFSIPNDTWTILGDPTQVHQILLNLSVNARDAMPNGGNLSIGVTNAELDEQYAAMNIQAKPGRYVVITVTDSGTGIRQNIIDKIFDPFFTTKDLNKGTGLGLSTVMAIVKSHEGIINVYSEPGKGTTFKVYLPAMDSSSETLKEKSERTSLPRGNGETILVVDDEASILVISSQTLQAFGYRVLTATDGAEAVAVYASQMDEIAVVLTDMAMPIMDGPATIHALMRINPRLKIIAASGLHANGDVAKSSGPGVKHFLTKPYTAATLLKTMRAILDET